MTKSWHASLAVILSLGIGSNAFGIGSAFIGNEVPSARAAGAGYVGVAAQNEDPTTVYVNPAGITYLKGTQATVGATWENVHGSYTNNSGNETVERTTNAGVPNLSVTQSFLGGKLGAGLSVQSPFGLETFWGSNSSLRYVATDSRLNMVDITPAIAYQIHPMVSIGAGVDYVDLFDAELDRQVSVDAVNTALNNPTALGGDAASSLRGDAHNWGYHAGIIFTPNEQNAIGITYHSQVNLLVTGNVTLNGLYGASAFVFGGSNYTTTAYTTLVLPSNVQLGYAFKPNSKWVLEADTAWFHWSDTKDLNIRYGETDPTRLAVLNSGNPTPLNLRDAWSFNTGANYKATDRLQLRGGFWYEPWAVPEADFSPAFMDLSRYGISTGIGYALSEKWMLDFAYNAVFMHNRTINNNVGLNTAGFPQADISGTYKDFANVLTLNLTYRFGSK